MAQYESESEASIPLDKFYIKRKGIGGLRGLLTKLHFTLSTGYGKSNFRHEFEGFTVLQQPDSVPKIFSTDTPTNGYVNWYNRKTASIDNSNLPGSFLVDSDTAEVGYKSKSFHIPLRATVHIEFNRYRIGGGYSFEFTKLGDFVPLSYGKFIEDFDPGFSSFFLKKYFLVLGASVCRYDNYLLTADVNIGGFSLGKNFDKSVISKGIFFNLGATVEREMSEYFRLFARPSYEFRNFKMDFEETSQTITHRFNAFYINVGIVYKIPELRRCFIKNCQAQINHAHGNREYRSRMHPIFKKQNPHYGENYPTLIKYKGKNKRKFNPY
jgi:hypothetical protein